MNQQEAASIIDSIVESIKKEPAQFHLNISVTGQQITSHGGTGLKVNVTGRGHGSRTIGNLVNLDGSNVEIAYKRGEQVMAEQMSALTKALEEISNQLKSKNPDRSLIKFLVESLKGKWVPIVIAELVGKVITLVFGAF